MESTSIRATTPRVSVPDISTLKCTQRSLMIRRSMNLGSPLKTGRKSIALRCIRAQQSELKDGSVTISPESDYKNALKIKEWEVGRFQEEIAANQGIRIRRRPPTGPPLHYVGPFEFRLQNEGNTPRNILEEIVWNKDMEVSQLKERRPLSSLKKALDNAPPVRDFVGALRKSHLRTGLPALIAEVKKASPSRGVLREDFDPVKIAQAYEKGGAACLSVLTDEKYFQGSFENLEKIRGAGIECPLLCKEFIIDAWQIYYARTKGADAILLIAAVLPDLDIQYMTKICKILGLAALVEVHDEREMDRVLGIDGIELIGINNRNLETFEVDISNTKQLLEGERGEIIRQKDIIVVGESGLFTPDDIAYVQEAGVKAVLVGESIVKQNDPGKGISGLFEMSLSTTDHSTGGNVTSDSPTPILDFRSTDDAWYTILLALENETLTVKYVGFSEEYNEEYNAGDFKNLKQVEFFEEKFRPASVQLQDTECWMLVTGMTVSASYVYSEFDLKFYNAVIDSITYKAHKFDEGEEECRCSFVVSWLHGPMVGSKESIRIEHICKLTSGSAQIDPTLASFLKMSREKLELASHNSGFIVEDDCSLEGVAVIDWKKNGQDIDMGGKPITAENLREKDNCHFILIDNLEKDLAPRTIVNFIHKHVSIKSQAYVFPSLLSETYTRGIIVVDSKEKLQKLSDFLRNPAHLIMSSSGRPWVMTEEKLKDRTFGNLMSRSEKYMINPDWIQAI
ncbi:Indole-3-glycerol phosphate synthase [Macleaya cordata]|uniref:indole-3-glycerol-phosphate synthase n=1 Tax=Macleaya cordata TaxID=56857 RepID=A0A200RAM3_MACCD|nr:Indole-3-glycerol phosphate synthase [Macleaya cordata]